MEELAFLRGAGSTKAQSRCIHENGTKMARIDRKLTESGTNCQKVLLCTKTTSDDVRSLALVKTLLCNKFGTYQPYVTPVTSQV